MAPTTQISPDTEQLIRELMGYDQKAPTDWPGVTDVTQTMSDEDLVKLFSYEGVDGINSELAYSPDPVVADDGLTAMLGGAAPVYDASEMPVYASEALQLPEILTTPEANEIIEAYHVAHMAEQRAGFIDSVVSQYPAIKPLVDDAYSVVNPLENLTTAYNDLQEAKGMLGELQGVLGSPDGADVLTDMMGNVEEATQKSVEFYARLVDYVQAQAAETGVSPIEIVTDDASRHDAIYGMFEDRAEAEAYFNSMLLLEESTYGMVGELSSQTRGDVHPFVEATEHLVKEHQKYDHAGLDNYFGPKE